MKIGITGSGSISPLGTQKEEINTSTYSENSFISFREFGGNTFPVAALSENSEQLLKDIARERKEFEQLDKTVLMAIYASRKAMKEAKWDNASAAGINIGSSRGATSIWENFHESYVQKPKTRISPLTSPNTTLGNISSWVAQDLGSNGISFSHSITCSTALHGLANGFAWLKSGLSNKFIVGGSEAPLTAFTIQQMRALGIYSKDLDKYPCKPFNGKKNTMVLGEGAASFCLESNVADPIAQIKGIGYATEEINHAAGISNEGNCLYDSMKMATDMAAEKIDLILMHAPGTIQGDASELHAIKSLFKEQIPASWTNKWKIGHTLGASGALSIICALEILQSQNTHNLHQIQNEVMGPVKNILINAVGFGGNAVSVVIGANS